MDPIQELKGRLARHSDLRLTVTDSSITVFAPSPTGFSVSLHASPKEYVVHFDGWHEHFASADEALECFAVAFSGKSRLAVTYRGRTPVKWVLEHLDEGVWRADSEVGHFLVPFWFRPRVVHLKNPNVLLNGRVER